ncbi:anti-sigma factor RsbA family regulatory protein [Planomonospora venezuelensis]|uniref:Anti-sigma regulatory factor (Ser/Thr protein kinase) n=1 Tax=Planomonospora venezuelensis TaxID=1999 RepID=A0A841D6P4_PLAVE|nr:anti-sigma regulatory factor (Ser/Thr protein kinase) [Planomonospora venezuelensis]
MQPERASVDSGPFAHTAVAYGSDEDFLRLVPDLVVEGLREGRRVLVVTCERKLDLLGGALGEDARRIDRRSSERWYAHPARTLAAYHDYVRRRERTTIIGEPRWSRWTGRQTLEWLRYESVLNTAFAGLPAAVWCLYDRATAPADILRTHPRHLNAHGVVPGGLYVPPERFALPGDESPFAEPPASASVAGFTRERLAWLRRTVGERARRAGMDRDLVASLVLSVSELAANTVEHGAGHGRVTLWREADGFVCEVADPGGGLDDPLAGYRPPEPESQRGYGLWISRQLCDRVEIRSTPGLLRIRLYMPLR